MAVDFKHNYISDSPFNNKDGGYTAIEGRTRLLKRFPRTALHPFLSLSGVIALSISLLAGCSTIRGFPSPPKTADVDPPGADWQLGPKAIKAYNTETDPAKQKILRDEIIDARLTAIDLAFSAYEREIYKEDITAGLAADWTLLALTAGTTVVGAASTKTALGAASTALVGGTASFDKRALFDKTLPALLSQMIAGREVIRAQIAKSKTQAVADYSWSMAESDLERFAYAGSLIGAIANITQDTGQKAVDAKQRVQDVTTGKYQKSQNSLLLQNFWKPGGTTNTDNQGRLEQWMTDHGISTAAGMITMFITTDIFEAGRAKAVSDLKLNPGS